MSERDESVLEFRELPPRARGRDYQSRPFWAKAAQMCRDKPGEWLFVGRHGHGVSAQIRRGTYAAFRPVGAFEVVVRDSSGRQGDLYIRYIGEDGAA